MFFVGGFFAMLIRLELLTPAGDLVSSDTYNKLFTMHGILMMFFFLIPSVPAVLGNFLIPMMIGAKDLAFPRINLRAGTSTLSARGLPGVDGHGRSGHRLDLLHAVQHHVFEYACHRDGVGIFIAGFTSILTGLNFIVTIHRMRAPGMTWSGCRCSAGRIMPRA